MTAWRVEFVSSARRELKKIAKQDRERILTFLQEEISARGNPRRVGHPLSGPLSGYWGYRVGDYRMIADIQDRILTVIVIRVGNRREVYR